MTKLKRLVAFMIDYYLILMICLIPYMIVNIMSLTVLSSLWYLLVLLFIILFLLKDLLFRNKSIGKKFLKLEIVTLEEKKPSIRILILRNIFLIMWPVDIFLWIIFNKRVGDFIFQTKVIETK